MRHMQFINAFPDSLSRAEYALVTPWILVDSITIEGATLSCVNDAMVWNNSENEDQSCWEIHRLSNTTHTAAPAPYISNITATDCNIGNSQKIHLLDHTNWCGQTVSHNQILYRLQSIGGGSNCLYIDCCRNRRGFGNVPPNISFPSEQIHYHNILKSGSAVCCVPTLPLQ